MTAMHHLCLRFRRHPNLSRGFMACQALVRFFALHQIKPHAPPLVRAAADHLIGMKFGMGTLDGMNHLKNKHIRSVADLLQDQFGLARQKGDCSERAQWTGGLNSCWMVRTPIFRDKEWPRTYDSSNWERINRFFSKRFILPHGTRYIFSFI